MGGQAPFIEVLLEPGSVFVAVQSLGLAATGMGGSTMVCNWLICARHSPMANSRLVLVQPLLYCCVQCNTATGPRQSLLAGL